MATEATSPAGTAGRRLRAPLIVADVAAGVLSAIIGTALALTLIWALRIPAHPLHSRE